MIAGAPELGTSGRGWAQALALILGTMALTARAPGTGAVVVVCLAGLIGVMAPVPVCSDRSKSLPLWTAVTGLGIGAVYLVAGLGPPISPQLSMAGLFATLAAAAAEEAFFRRFMYGWLALGGPMPAIAGAAIAFAAVHLPLYGPAVFPLNLAAGLLFGWQRWASESWTAPAATHVMANLIGMGLIS